MNGFILFLHGLSHNGADFRKVKGERRMMERVAVLLIALILQPISFSTAKELKPFVPSMQLGGDLDVSKMREQNLNVIKKAVEGIGETLPQRVDAYTTMVGIDSNGTRLIYTFEVDGGPKSDETLRKEGKVRMAPIIKRGICQSAARFLQAGIDISYRYLSKASKQEILRVDVSEKECPAHPVKKR
jgi:hypothetical protein